MRHYLLATFIAIQAVPAAASEAQTDALWEARRFGDYAEVLAAEGLDGGAELADTLFPDDDTSGWADTVERIYDVTALKKTLSRALHDELDAHDMAEAVAFFESKTGARSIELEISARWALLAPDIESMSIEHMNQMAKSGDPRLEMVRTFADLNGLVENNVVSSMNGNYAFLTALSEAGQGPYVNDQGALMSAVWEQEEEIRADTEEWVLSFFTFAYSPLNDAEMQEIIDFSKKKQGQRLNSALFACFDVLYDDISAQLGTAAARYMAGERL